MVGLCIHDNNTFECERCEEIMTLLGCFPVGSEITSVRHGESTDLYMLRMERWLEQTGQLVPLGASSAPTAVVHA